MLWRSNIGVDWGPFTFFSFFLRVFWSGPFKKVFIEFITILVYVLVFWPWGMWNPSSQTMDRTGIPCTGKWSPSHWTTRNILRLWHSLFSFLQGVIWRKKYSMSSLLFVDNLHSQMNADNPNKLNNLQWLSEHHPSQKMLSELWTLSVLPCVLYVLLSHLRKT